MLERCQAAVPVASGKVEQSLDDPQDARLRRQNIVRQGEPEARIDETRIELDRLGQIFSTLEPVDDSAQHLATKHLQSGP